MNKVLLTGANGFVGLNIADRLLANNYELVAYVRPQSKVQYLENMRVEISRGELNDRDALSRAMHECDFVIHTAGNTSCYNSDLPMLTRTNVEGTRAVVEAAIEQNVKRLVFTSTTSTVGARNNPAFCAAEDQPLTGFRAGSPYAKTKTAAEKIVRDANARGLQTIILNLAEVIGAYDHNLQWGRMVLAVAHDQVPFIPPGGGTFCSARNAAQAHVNALTQGVPGERYIIGGVNESFAGFIDKIGERLKTKYSTPSASYRWLLLNARAHEKLPGVFKNKPPVDPYRMRVFGGHYFFNSARARQELGYQVASLDSMLDESVSWYRQNGFI